MLKRMLKWEMSKGKGNKVDWNLYKGKRKVRTEMTRIKRETRREAKKEKKGRKRRKNS